MTPDISENRIRLVLLSAIAMTLGAEVFYLVVFGMILYPEGNLLAKIIWASTCGVAMGSVIGAGALLIVRVRQSATMRFWLAAGIVTTVGSYCAWLCSRIDVSFDYFGGAENSVLFILAGVVPAVIGGVVYGWIIKDDRFVLQKI